MLQFITHRTERFDPVQATRAVLEGGCRWVQLRIKDAPLDHVLSAGQIVGRLCREYGAKFIVDDHVDIVEALQADGVHLGKNDMPVDQARRILGKDRIIGATANTFADIERAAALGADYIGLGPFRYTATKRNLSPILGLQGYRDLMRQCRQAGLTLPVVAIGGITDADIPAILGTGVTGIALSGALLQAEDPIRETQKIISTIKCCKNL